MYLIPQMWSVKPEVAIWEQCLPETTCNKNSLKMNV